MAMHQPNYLPWLGYFCKMMSADIFVYLDVVQYPRGKSFAARNQIKTPNGAAYLSVPVSVPPGFEGRVTYQQIQFAGEKWKGKHLRTIELNYKKAPYFEEVFDFLNGTISEASSFTEMNIQLIDNIADYLGIEGKRKRLSEILPSFGQKSELIVDICHAVDANVYLSGKGGGLEYNDEGLLRENGIELRYSEFSHPSYPQLWGDFAKNLSIVDLLFNCGKDSAAVIRGDVAQPLRGTTGSG
jgi:hypothetical protein